jgi:hypothetical protein
MFALVPVELALVVCFDFRNRAGAPGRPDRASPSLSRQLSCSIFHQHTDFSAGIDEKSI